MRQLLNGKLAAGVGVLTLIGMLFLLAGATEVSAQFTQFMGRASQLEPEQAQAAWTLAAQGVARDLGLSKDNTTKLVNAYKAARESYQKATQEMMAAGGGAGGARGGGGGALQGLMTTEQTKFQTALGGFLSKEQVTKAMESLGTFSSEWDNMLNVLAGFKLGEGPLYKALALVTTYVVDYNKAVNAAMASQDFQAMQTVRTTTKAKLDSGLSGILSASQLVEWNTATAPRTRGAPPGGGS